MTNAPRDFWQINRGINLISGGAGIRRREPVINTRAIGILFSENILLLIERLSLIHSEITTKFDHLRPWSNGNNDSDEFFG